MPGFCVRNIQTRVAALVLAATDGGLYLPEKTCYVEQGRYAGRRAFGVGVELARSLPSGGGQEDA